MIEVCRKLRCPSYFNNSEFDEKSIETNKRCVLSRDKKFSPFNCRYFDEGAIEDNLFIFLLAKEYEIKIGKIR